MIYNFVIPEVKEFPLDQLRMGKGLPASQCRFQGEFVWGYQTYLYLKKSDLPVQLSFDLNPGAVNLAHGNVLRALGKHSNCFCVSLQADYPQYPMAQYHIVQNSDQSGEKSSYIPHWPLPDQVPRDPARRGVQNVAYQGDRSFTVLDPEHLSNDLQKFGIAFYILDSNQWRNLQEVDVLIGVRHFGHKRYRRKPPTKLINAWHAGIPFIGGWDSAFSQIGEPGVDYLRVATYDELLENIVRLKDDPGLYSRLAEAGRRRSRDFSNDAITARWMQILRNEVAREYRRWSAKKTKSLRYEVLYLKYAMHSAAKTKVKLLYKIPLVSRLRDRYYDPVK